MISTLKRKLNPPCYQGNNSKSAHFEGWYFKIIDESQTHSFAIIPGVFKSRDQNESHAFIQLFNGQSNNTTYIRFPINEFSAAKNRFEIQIGRNFFSTERISLDLENDEFSADGELRFENITPWPKTMISPGIMGWYTWVPFMECYHGVVSLNHQISGALTLNKQSIDFTDGRGYAEKDWGKSFPEAWIWCQTNHFNSPETSLTASVAIIPWIRRPFLGFIMGLWHNNKLYRFTTYNRSRLTELNIGKTEVQWTVQNSEYQLRVTSTRSEGRFLQAPKLKGMTHKISESLNSVVHIELTKITGKEDSVILEDRGNHAGFEVAGNLQRLVDMFRKGEKHS